MLKKPVPLKFTDAMSPARASLKYLRKVALPLVTAAAVRGHADEDLQVELLVRPVEPQRGERLRGQ
jgi:hypothetical protein